MTRRTKEQEWFECDGCGYSITERMTTLELYYDASVAGHKDRGKFVLHFHQVTREHDCLRYFITGPGVIGRFLSGHHIEAGSPAWRVLTRALDGSRRTREHHGE